MRYAADVFQEASRVLNQERRENFYRRLSPQEKQKVCDYMTSNGGPKLCDWKEVAKLVDRPVEYDWNMRQRYYEWQDGGKRGTFTLEEDKFILASLFPSNFQTAQHISKADKLLNILKSLTEDLGRSSKYGVYNRLFYVLLPTILQYHAGTMNYDIRKIFLSFLKAKGCKYLQDIDWIDLLNKPQFAGHGRMNLTYLFNGLRRSTARKLKCDVHKVTVSDIVKYFDENCPSRNTMKGRRTERQTAIIQYYTTLIETDKPEKLTKS